jgi:hydroxymethylbilane synthase
VKGRVRIGTRGSRLARAQAEWVRGRLEAADRDCRAELVIIRTSGDRVGERPLAALGGKGLFVKEIEEALAAGTIDCAVHSLKDLPGELAPGLRLAAVPERADPRDVAVTRAPGGLRALSRGARVGTSSPRRAALLRALWPAVEVVDMRGNVDTRLQKLEAGEVDALVLAAAGLARLGIAPAHAEPCDPLEFVPAIGQGALAVETREDEFASLARVLEDGPSRRAVDAERAFLRAVGGSCLTPLGAHATVGGDALVLGALIASPDGARIVRGEASGAARDAERIGGELAETLLRGGGAEILAAIGAAR